MDGISMYLQEVGWGHGLDCCGSTQGQVAGSCECGNESSGSAICDQFPSQGELYCMELVSCLDS